MVRNTIPGLLVLLSSVAVASFVPPSAAQVSVTLTLCILACAEWYRHVGHTLRPKLAGEIAAEAAREATLKLVAAQQKQLLESYQKTSVAIASLSNLRR